ncbi:MAG TPA: glycosyltransferase [Bacteroidales bacterium]|nr:glycosyltransferase [Bacteroidales bacterium]
MKKLLILAYDFPPYVSVGGLRPYSWYKYMHEFGIFPVVVTRQWANKYGNHLDYIAPGESNDVIIEESEKGIIIRAPYKPTLANRLMLRYGENRFKFLRKIITGWYEFVQWFLPVGTKYSIYKAAKEFLKTNKVDCIIATGDPFILFRYASILSKKHNIPWIADYRDPWAQDTNNSYFIRKIFLYLERKIVSRASRITTVSQFLINLIKSNLKNQNFKIVYNGYDSFSLPTNYPNQPSNKVLTIAYAGTIYHWHPWKQFLSVINSFSQKEHFPIFLKFYGINNEKELNEYFKNFQNNYLTLEVFPKKSNTELLKELVLTDILLLFNDYYIIGTKIFDYLAVRKKILFCFSNDTESLLLKEKFYHLPDSVNNDYPQIQLINQTNSGLVASNQQHLFELLKEIKTEFNQSGKIVCHSQGYEFYSRKNQTKILAELIKELTDE